MFSKNKQLTEKEKRELKILDNPNVKFMSPPVVIPILIDLFSAKKKRKKKVVKLRTRMRLYELQIDPNKDREAYYKIIKEEEKRFDERFKNIK